MSDESLKPLEQQLVSVQFTAAPPMLRDSVLAGVHRQLAREQRDRWWARGMAGLLLVGIGLNWTVNLNDGTAAPAGLSIASNPNDIVGVALAVTEATDPQTANRIAEQLAAVGGTSLTAQEMAAMKQEILRRTKSGAPSRKEG